MSIQDVVRSWVASGEPVVMKPVLTAVPRVRAMVTDVEVGLKLYGPWIADAPVDRFKRTREVVDAFIGGSRMVTRLPPSKSVIAQLALLEPGSTEVGEFRSRDPNPGTRVFGRFAARDVFIALDVAFRENIDDDFRREIERCKRRWRRFFPSYGPHRGTEVAHYLSGGFPV